MLIYSLFRSAREGPADKQACTLFSQQKGGGAGWENLVNPSPEPGLYKGTYPSVLRGQRRGSQESRREGSQGDHVHLCLHLPRRRRLHPHNAGGDLVNLADAKQRPRSESREPGKKPWRLALSSEAPQVNLLSSPNSSTFLHAHTRPLAFAGSSSIHVAEEVLYEHVMETPSR